MEPVDVSEMLTIQCQPITYNSDNSEHPLVSVSEEHKALAITSKAEAQTDLQLIQAQNKEYNYLINDYDYSIPKPVPVLNGEEFVPTVFPQGEMEMKVPQIGMVFSEYNEATVEVLRNVEAAPILSTESTRITECETPQINAEYNLSYYDTSRDEIIQEEQTKPDQPQIDIISHQNSDFCRLEPILCANNSRNVSNEQFNTKTNFNEQNNNSPITEAMKIPQITQVYSEKNKQAENVGDITICDKLIQEAATSNTWKQIPIKQELIDIDEDFDVIDYSITSIPCIKPEFPIKSEDIIDVDEIPEIIFECKNCNRKFPQESILRLHIICHENTKLLKCDECDFITKKRTKMLAHLRNHTGEKKIKCKICKETYFNYNELRHFQRCPKPMRNFFYCNDCDYSTTLKYRYVRHVRLHTGERLKCCWCEQDFESDAALRKHRKKHAKEKRYQCQFCYRRFKLQNARERHILAYCDKKCPKCEYISIYCSDFYEHIMYAHPFTKLKNQLRRHYNLYENTKARRQMDNIQTQSESVTKYEASQDYEPSIGCEMDIKIQHNTDYELMQNIKYEFTESTENYGYDSINLGADYDYHLMQNNKFNLTENVCNKQNEFEEDENIDYDLIQNVNCELNEDAEDYTLLCL